MSKRVAKHAAAWIALGAIILVALSWAPDRAFAIPDRFVDDSGNDQGGANTCANPLQPCKTIVHAISQALAGETILVGAGTYTNEKTANDEKGIVVDKRVAIFGAGAGLTIVQAAATAGTATHRVFTIGSERAGGGVVLRGMTIRYGRAPDGHRGGGIAVNETQPGNMSLTVSHSEVVSNQADAGGGISFLVLIEGFGEFGLIDSTVSDNVAHCQVGNCVAAGGGVLGNIDARFTIRRSTISGNHAECFGLACRAEGGGLFLNSNSGFEGSIPGGSNFANVMNSTISTNTASCEASGQCFARGGGIFFRLASDLVASQLLNVTISGNRAHCAGSLCYQQGGSVHVQSDGVDDPSLNVSFTTVVQHVDAPESVLSTQGLSSGTTRVRFRGSMISTKAGQACAIDSGTTMSAIGTNFATDGSCSGFTQKSVSQLKLGKLALNSPGTTRTHALLGGSHAINASSCLYLPDNFMLATDQRGVSRPQGSACDVGAYERVP